MPSLCVSMNSLHLYDLKGDLSKASHTMAHLVYMYCSNDRGEMCSFEASFCTQYAQVQSMELLVLGLCNGR